jgi:predicted nuclease of predicted toxin-antitoxin system
MKVLVDENLPETLLSALGEGSVHVRKWGTRLSDAEIWNRARSDAFVLLTKDADFFDRLALEGSPPKVVWVRIGNQRRGQLEQRIAREWPNVTALLKTVDLVEIHPDRLEGIRFD